MTSLSTAKPGYLKRLARRHQLLFDSLQLVRNFDLLVCTSVVAFTGGESGSADTVFDPRGFAVKFYTEDGNWDLVGNNTPIFFIRDPIFVRSGLPLVPLVSSLSCSFSSSVCLPVSIYLTCRSLC